MDSGIVKTFCEYREKGCVNPAFIKKHELTKNTLPHDYMNILLPLDNNIVDGEGYVSSDLF